MIRKKYLPVWTDGLSYKQQHLTYWISNNDERVNQSYSFLPIRMLGDFFCERKKFYKIYLISDYFEKERCRTTSYIMPLAYYVAEKAFDLAAAEFFDKYPEALGVCFKNLGFNGVYHTEFTLDYQKRLALFKKILDEKIQELCVVDESFEYTRDPDDKSYHPWHEYTIRGMLDIKESELWNLPSHLARHGFPYIPKKQVKVKAQDIYEYYHTIPERIFVLGNQYVKYSENGRVLAEFFNAAKNRDLSLIKKFVASGVDINSIDSDGSTAFVHYIGIYPGRAEKQCDASTLQEFINLGANVAIYGAGLYGEPLSGACLDEHFDIIEFLLESGVSPHLYPCMDEPCEDIVETLLERTERWAVGDPAIDGIPSEAQQKILELLRQYA